MLRFLNPTAVLKARKPSQLELVVDRLAPKMSRAIQEAAFAAQGRIDLDVLAANIETGRVSRTIEQLNMQTFVAEDLSAAMDFLVEANEAGRNLGTKRLRKSDDSDKESKAVLDQLRDPSIANPRLRGQKELSAEQQAHVRALDAAIRNNPSAKDEQVVYRAINRNILTDGHKSGLVSGGKVKPGAVFTDEGFISTSTSRASVNNPGYVAPSDRAVLHIKVPAGAPRLEPSSFVAGNEKATELAAWEREILLPRGSKFRIDRVDGRDIYVTMIDTPTGLPQVSSTAPLGIDFKTANPKALLAAERQAATLLSSVNSETKQTVRDLIARAYRDKISPRDTARLIRDVVGLNDRQSTALFNYRAGLVEDGRAADQIERMTAKYGDRLLRQRADTIAQTEIHRASAEGQHELWREGVREGRINPNTARRIWIANSGACEWCSAMETINAEGVPIDGQFETPDGDMIDGPEESHVGCRCSTGLETE